MYLLSPKYTKDESSASLRAHARSLQLAAKSKAKEAFILSLVRQMNSQHELGNISSKELYIRRSILIQAIDDI